MRSILVTLISLALFANQTSSLPIPIMGFGHNKDEPGVWRPRTPTFDGTLTSDFKYDKNHRYQWAGNDSFMNTERISEEFGGHFNTDKRRGTNVWYKDEFIRDHAPPAHAGAVHKRQEGWKSMPVQDITFDMNKIPCQSQKVVTVTATATATATVAVNTIYVTPTATP